MKRLGSILLLCLYVIATSGAIIKMHYCGSSLESWKLLIQEEVSNVDGCCTSVDDSCSKSESETKCCSDEFVALKIHNDYNANVYQIQLPGFVAFVLPEISLPNYPQALLAYIHERHTHSSFVNQAIGLWQSIPLYSLFQQRKVFDGLV